MNWIKTGWGKSCSAEKTSVNEKFCLDCTAAIKSDRPLSEIASSAVLKIKEEYPSPFYIMTSGGIDSQATIWCWKQAKVDFIPVCIRYIDNNGMILNSHDISNIEKFSTYYNLSVKYLDFNLIDFLEKKLVHYATTYECTSPQITAYMSMSEMITDGTIIFSGDFLDTAIYNYTIFGLWRYQQKTNRNMIPYFLLHNPELTTALRHHYEVKDNRTNGKKNAYLKKVESMLAVGIKIFPQELKFSGFEYVKEIYDSRVDLISFKDKIKYSDKPSKRIFDIAFRYKLSELIKYEDELIWIK